MKRLIVEFNKDEEYLYDELLSLKKKYYKNSWKDLFQMMVYKFKKYG